MTSKGGPKTIEGKLISSKNSLKHGLTAKGLISTEEEVELNSLTEELKKEYEPEGPIEKLLVEDLAMIRIQLERFKAVEAALFINSQSTAIGAQSLVESLQIKQEKIRVELIEAINTESDFENEHHKRSEEWLSNVQALMVPESALSEKCKELIKKELRSESVKHSLKPLELIDKLEKQSRDPDEPITSICFVTVSHEDIELEKADRDRQLDGIKDSKLRDFVFAKESEILANTRKQKLLDAALKQKESLINAALPDPGELDRIYRYRTSLEKQFSNKLSQIIQLQQMRERRAKIGSRN